MEKDNSQTHGTNVYQNIVNKYRQNDTDYQGVKEIKFSLSRRINLTVLGFVIISGLLTNCLASIVNVCFIGSPNSVYVNYWVGLDVTDLSFHWALSWMVILFSLRLSHIKNQINYYYVLWILLSIHQSWDSLTGFYYLFYPGLTHVKNTHINGLGYSLVVLSLSVGSITSFLTLCFSVIALFNLPEKYVPKTDLGKKIKHRQKVREDKIIAKIKLRRESKFVNITKKN